MRLTATELNLIRRNQPTYLEAERLTGVPWRMLATLHYMENSCRTESPGPGGPFQIDPPPDTARLERALKRYKLPIKRVEEDFFTASVFAADFLQGKTMGRLHVDTADEALIKDAFWSYNGRAYGSADDSPYVANDPPTRVLRVRGTVIGRDGTRISVDQPFRKHGALFIYRELLALFPPESGGAQIVVVDAGQAGWETFLRDDSRPFVPYRDMRGRDFLYARSCADGDTLLGDWRPTLPAAGRYIVEAFIPGVHATTRHALYFVKGALNADDQPEERAVELDQLSARDEWVLLDTFRFDPAVPDSGVVRLTNYSTEAPETELAFDAVRWRPA